MEVESFVLFFWVNRQDRLVQSVQQPVSTALWVRDESDRVLFQGTAGAGVHAATSRAGGGLGRSVSELVNSLAVGRAVEGQ